MTEQSSVQSYEVMDIRVEALIVVLSLSKVLHNLWVLCAEKHGYWVFNILVAVSNFVHSHIEWADVLFLLFFFSSLWLGY